MSECRRCDLASLRLPRRTQPRVPAALQRPHTATACTLDRAVQRSPHSAGTLTPVQCHSFDKKRVWEAGARGVRRDALTPCVARHAARRAPASGASAALPRAGAVARRLRREPGRQAAVRRPAQQLQQAGAAGAQRQRRAHRAHQAQAQPAHRREPQESDNDYEPVGGAELVRLQAVVGAARVWRRGDAARAFRPHLAARHRALQQCGRKLRGDPGDEGDVELHGPRGVAPARHLQVLVRDRRGVLPLRPADLRHEVRLLDLRRFPGGPATYRRGARHQRGGTRRGPLRVLHLRGVGHPGGAGRAKREVLHVLRRAVPGHHVQHHHAAQDAVLHRQPHHPLHGHLLPHRAGLLPALRQRGEGVSVHLYPAVAHGVLPAAGGDHPAHFAGGAAARQVRALHHDPRHLQHMRDGSGTECALPVAADAHHGAVGAARVYPRTPAPSGDAAPALPPRAAPQPLRWAGDGGVRELAVGRGLAGAPAPGGGVRGGWGRGRGVPRARRAGAVRGAAALAPLPRAAQGHRRHQLHRRPDEEGGGVHEGEGGLEVRGHGAGPAVPVDLHAGGGGGVGRHHPAGAHAVRRARAHRRAPLGDRVRHGQAAPAAAALAAKQNTIHYIVNKLYIKIVCTMKRHV